MASQSTSSGARARRRAGRPHPADRACPALHGLLQAVYDRPVGAAGSHHRVAPQSVCRGTWRTATCAATGAARPGQPDDPRQILPRYGRAVLDSGAAGRRVRSAGCATSAPNAPPGAPSHCIDSCPFEGVPCVHACAYLDLHPIHYGLAQARSPVHRVAGRLAQLSPDLLAALARVVPPLRQLSEYEGWPRSVITDRPGDLVALIAALKYGPGRCVYKCDNDVVDHQVGDGLRTGFATSPPGTHEKAARCASTAAGHAAPQVQLQPDVPEVRDHRDWTVERMDFPNEVETGGHGGGDDGLMRAFIASLADRSQPPLTSARACWRATSWPLPPKRPASRVACDMDEFRAQADKLGAGLCHQDNGCDRGGS